MVLMFLLGGAVVGSTVFNLRRILVYLSVEAISSVDGSCSYEERNGHAFSRYASLHRDCFMNVTSGV
jgi:hypothetical protein